ncbi:hypothetical protein [Amycolatopsis sp. lyj-112]|uniref:hypothetical protein n=1 Tax=Amycolatopsis sp. lyj-112 TaxID=2789288 RepID=UPI00397AF577
MNQGKPRKPFRILRTADGAKAAISYASRNARDKAAERYAAQDGTIIALEFWDEKNRHDHLNEGWACEGLVHPPGSPTHDNRDTVRTTYRATTPPAGPDVMTLKPGSSLGDLIVVTVAAADEHNVYTCRDCSQAFNVGQVAVIARYKDDDVLHGFHPGCAKAYREGHTPLVVTVHADGTASVTGPPTTTITVVTEL